MKGFRIRKSVRLAMWAASACASLLLVASSALAASIFWNLPADGHWDAASANWAGGCHDLCR
ncbi:MAG: hypothetical protein ACOX9C_09450 [Kiritimatiellia bacterium]